MAIKIVILNGQRVAIDDTTGRIQIDGDGGYQTIRITAIITGASVNWVTALEAALGTGTVDESTGHILFLPATGVSAYYNVGAAASAATILVPSAGIQEPYNSEDVIDARIYGTGGKLFIVEMK